MLSASQIRSSFLAAISQSLADYHAFGPRSSKKLRAPHRWIAESVLARLGDGFRASSLGIGDGKEKTVPGKYYDKTVDVAVEKIGADNNARVAAVASFKFVTSNYKQNSINYFEGLIECPHKPEVLGIALVDVDGDKVRFCEEDSDLEFSGETVAALREDLSVERFAEKFAHLCQLRA